MENLTTASIAIITSGLTTGLIVFFLKETFKSYISSVIKFEFDQKLEDYKAKEIKRQKAILIADLISEWISFPKEKKRLNQLTFEAFIWLPKETAIKLSSLLALKSERPSTRDVLAEVRGLIMGDDEKIDPDLIIVFPEDKKES